MSYPSAEIVHWFKNKDKFAILPAQVDIDLTNICNQDCFYCNSAEHRAQQPVQKKYQEYIELLDKLASWRAHTPNSSGSLHAITYPGGGEPTLLPGYERVIEHTIDLGFLTSITTNGTQLDKLIEQVSPEKIRQMAWIGIDIDAGTEELYETIRRSIPKRSPFKQVLKNARELVELGANVDLKILLNQYNDNPESLEDVFLRCREVGARQLYIRPTLFNNSIYNISDTTEQLARELGVKHNVNLKFNKTKDITRNYTRCHQMYQFPVFCADGHIYVCCDNKGNPAFSIGRWDQGDFRDLWLSERHHKIYNQTNTQLCPPCRPNYSNIKIQNIIDDPDKLEVLYI
jgi:sulfatase maturation enzyme AslB (radical SAM superfamily)